MNNQNTPPGQKAFSALRRVARDTAGSDQEYAISVGP